ncbi:MAG: hypothetical protein RQ750_00640 [Roseovarius sp.]|nr:hypothetical protein [Roseovarius sp.]
MITRAIGFFFLLVFAQAGLAQTIEVRSGDHDDFTRLVLNLPERLEWTSETSANGVSVVFPNGKLVFDTSKVFDRISRDRLKEISAPAGAARLDLAFDCECTIRPFWNDRTMLVIDIAESASKPTPIPQPAHASARPNQNMTRNAPMKQKTVSAAATMLSEHLDNSLGIPIGNVVATPAARLQAPEPATPGLNLPRMQEELLNNLARAASQGLLTPRRGAKTRRAAATGAPIPDPEESTEPEPAKVVPTPLSANLNLHAQSSIDREMRTHFKGKFSLSGHADCTNDNLIDIPAWGTEATFHTQVGALSGRLLGEFDTPDRAVALELARLYAYFGFGHEMRQVLSFVETDDSGTDVLREMSVIFDEGHAPPGSLFAGQLGCDNASALWAALSYETLPQDTAIDLDAIQRGFAALPRHLRRYLGPLLSTKLTRVGHVETANQILRIIDRIQTDEAPAASMARAELAQAEGEPRRAEAALETVAESNSEPSADAVLKLINQKLDAQQGISFDLAQLAGAYAQENRGAPLGQDLAQAYLSALAASGAFEQSYAEFDRLLPDLAPQHEQPVRESLIAHLTESADTIDFLRYTLAGRAGDPTNLKPETASAIARRLLENGFETAALGFVARPSAGLNGRPQRLLRAEIALAQNRSRQAEIELIGINGPDADALRAQALEQAGEHRAASEFFMASDQPKEAEKAAWMAGDWDQVGTSDEPVLQDVARLMQAVATTKDPQVTGVLAQNRKLLEESAKARKTLENLLEAKPGPQG